MKKGSIRIQNTPFIEAMVLPCKIEYSGEVDHSGYLPTESTGSLLGRKLEGQTIKIPEGFQGFATTGTTDLMTSGEFTEIKYWNWDLKPTDSDQIPQLLNHLHIMKALSE